MIVDKLGEGHYQTRNGLPVVIESIKGIREYPVRGYVIKKDGSKGTLTWTKEGVWNLELTPHDLDLIPVAQPESKQKRPVNVGIPYTNELERKAAIKQAESYGYKEWRQNQMNRSKGDNCIWLNKDGDWYDAMISMEHDTIPIDRSFMESDGTDTNVATVFTFPTSDYTKTENEDGTILLTPIDKKYQANYEKALQFLDKTPENVMWPHSDLAKILVEFLNSVNHAD